MRNFNFKNGTQYSWLSHHGYNLRCIWLFKLSQKQYKVDISQDSCRKCSNQITLTEVGVEHSSCRSLSDNISYLIQSLVKQSFLCNFSHLSSLVLPVSTPPQTSIFSGLNLCADNLSYLFQSFDRESYLCNFSPFGFYFNEKKFQVHDCQLLLFNYVVTIQVQVIANISFLALPMV